MAKNVKFKINLPGLNALMKSDYIKDKIDAAAKAVRDQCGDGYESDVDTVNWVCIGHVRPITSRAISDNSQNNTMIRAIGAVGLPTEKK